ncbi:hypothetical protein BJY00DRAFT_315071 [Aspergillus carlsbadensis]|nr:hypothetical protein BJY00DRAFT_315071 [Aspergillus carlsbadensis]
MNRNFLPRLQSDGFATDVVAASQKRRVHRAALACQHCRDRKVRCTLGDEGAPCLNCRLDGRVCVAASRKHRPPGAVEGNSTADIGDAASRDTDKLDGNRLSQPEDAVNFNMPDEIVQALSLAPTVDHRRRKSPTMVPFSYYPFLKAPNLSNLQPEDIAYLDAQKCFHVPVGKFVETLISHYFLYVHPCLPIVNEAEFWSIFRQRETGQTFSLLVFQAMLFVASSVSVPLNA